MKPNVWWGVALAACLVVVACGGDPSPEKPISRAPDAGVGPLSINPGPDHALCPGGAAVIGPSPQAGFQYHWSPATGLSSTSVAQPTANPTETTRYALDVTAPSGAKGSASVQVTVRSAPHANAGASSAVCSGSTVALGSSAVTGLTYSWSPTTGLDDPHASAPHASPAQTTTYQLKVTDTFGCSATSSVKVSVAPTPALDALPSFTVENGGAASFAAAPSGGTPPYQYAWTASDPACAGGTCFSSTSAASTTVSPASSSDISLTLRDAAGCSVSRSGHVTVLAPFLVSAGGDRGICAGDSVNVGTDPSGGLAPYTFAWSASDPTCADGSCFSDVTASSPLVTPASTTQLTELVTDALGAQSTSSATVSVYPDPGSAGPDAYLASGGSAVIGPTAVSGATYAWTCDRTDCAISDASAAQPEVSPSRSTAYTLAASSGAGCDKSSATTVWVGLQTRSAPDEGALAFPVSSALQIQFDQTMLDSAFTADSVQLSDANTGNVIPATFSYDAFSRTLTVHPPAAGTQGYASGNDYTLTLTGGPAGVVSDDPILPNILFSDLTLDFTTGAADVTPPSVVYRTPPAGATNAAINSAIQATFDEALDASTVNIGTFQVAGPSGAVDGTVSYDFGSRTATFVPSAPLDPNATYTVSIVNVADLSGNLGGDTWSFTTGSLPDTTAPTVVSVTPMDGEVGVASTSPVTITFSEPVYPGSFGAIRLRDLTHGGTVGGTLTYDALTQTVTFTPAEVLAGSTSFELDVAGVQDLAGNVMSAPFTSTFSTLRTLFFDDFEHGTANWSLPPNSAGQAWSTTTRASTSPLHSLTDSDHAKYASNTVSVAQTVAPIDVIGVSNVTLEFAVRTRTQRFADYFYVDLSVDGGPWVEVDKPGSTQGWSGNGPWSRWTIPVSIPSGSSLSLRLRLQTDNKKNFDGVYVDDVMIQAP